jgi:hypothetical protein
VQHPGDPERDHGNVDLVRSHRQETFLTRVFPGLKTVLNTCGHCVLFGKENIVCCQCGTVCAACMFGSCSTDPWDMRQYMRQYIPAVLGTAAS